MVTQKITIDEFNALLTTSKYGALYMQVCANGFDRPRPKSLRGKSEHGYERHHIVPRAFGGVDENNLVKLTTYEHYLAHYYLVLLTDNVHMYHAFNLMMGQQYTKLSDVEKIKLNELEHWARIRDESRKRMFSKEGRKTIAKKAKERWAKWKESGEIEQIKINIAKTTAEGMKQSKKSQIRTRVNLGCKKYWNPETGEQRNWYPGMPEFESPWVRGRKPMSQEQKDKIRKTFREHPKVFYHNDELKINSTFDKDATVPDGWVLGFCEAYRYNGIPYKRKVKEDKLATLMSED